MAEKTIGVFLTQTHNSSMIFNHFAKPQTMLNDKYVKCANKLESDGMRKTLKATLIHFTKETKHIQRSLDAKAVINMILLHIGEVA